MLKDTTVYATLNNDGETMVLKLVFSAEQLESTMLRRVKTFMPNAKDIRLTNEKPDSAQLEIRAGAKK